MNIEWRGDSNGAHGRTLADSAKFNEGVTHMVQTTDGHRSTIDTILPPPPPDDE